MGSFFSSNRNIRIAAAAVIVVSVMCLSVAVVATLVVTRYSRAKGVATLVANPITEARIAVSPPEGYAGTQLTVTGANWRPGEVVFVRLQAAAGVDNENYAYAGAVADDKGQFSSSFTYPYDSKWLEGDLVQVVARAEASGVQSTAPFRLTQPTVMPTPTELVTATPTDTPIPPEELTPLAPGMPTPTRRPLPTLPPPPPVPPITDWMGVYYNNTSLQGQPVLIRNDQAINFDWAMGSPDPQVRTDSFSVQWTRNQNFDAGNYRFLLRVDDGVRFYVDNQPVIDQWHDGPTQVAVELYMTPGSHALRMDYFEHVGWALAQLSWQRIDASYPDWKGEYFNNPDLSGSPAFVRNDPWVDFNWGTGAPGPSLPADSFSVRWTRRLHFDEGSYRFSARVDDGARLWVDDQLLIDQWHDSGLTTYVADRSLSAGDHNVRVEYYDRAGAAEAHLFWERSETASYPDWKGEYFSNRKLEGSPDLVRNDVEIAFDWGSRGPGGDIPGETFSARWTQRVRFDSTAQYLFHARVDDGVRLWVDDNLILDDWNTASLRDVSATARVSKGDHDVRIEYYAQNSKAMITVGWDKVGATATPKPGPTNTSVANPTATAVVVPTATVSPIETAQPVEQNISLAPSEGAVNSTITVKGANWPAGQTVVLALAQPQPNAKTLQVSPQAAVGNVKVGATGEFKIAIAIPAGQGWEGQAQVLVVAYTSDLKKTALATFAITASQPQPQPTEAQPQPTEPQPQPTEAQPQPTKQQPVEPTQAAPATPSEQPTEPAATATPTQVPPTPTTAKPTATPKPTNTSTPPPKPTDTPAPVEKPTVAAQPIISLAPISGTVGITLTVKGQGWPADNDIVFSLARPAADPNELVTVPVTGTAKTSNKGVFTTQVPLPAGAGWEDAPQVIVVARTADEAYQAIAPYSVVMTGTVGAPEPEPAKN